MNTSMSLILKVNSQSGQTRLGSLITLIFFAAAGYAAWCIVPFFYYYSEMLGIMEAQASKAQVFTDAEIRKNLMKKVKELNLPIDNADELKINRFSGVIRIELEYQEVFYFSFRGKDYDIYTFHFNPVVESPY